MRRFHLLVIISLLFVIYILNSSIYATEPDSSNTIQTSNIIAEEENKKKALEAINKNIEEIKQEITKINTMLNSIKEKDEYINYPAIRLNIDTPIFGLTSVCEQKLKITSEVSTTDIAGGYSIKDIIKTNSLKVPSFSVGSIVVITRDIVFDENISLSDANTCIIKLMQYIEQAKSVNKFLDTQITKIYSQYIPKEKANKIDNLKNKLSNIKNNINKTDKEIVKLYITNINNEKYNKFLNSYISINNNIYNYENVLKNVLISDETLLEYEKKVLDLESEYIVLNLCLNDVNKELASQYDIETMVTLVRNDLVSRKDKVENYITNSVTQKNIENIENNQINNETQEDLDANLNNQTAIEEITNYTVNSKETVAELNKKIETLDAKIVQVLGQAVLDKIKGINKEEISEEVINKSEVANVVTKELSVDEKSALLDEIYNLYTDFLKSENTFYLNNTNLLLKDTTNKVTSLSEYTDFNTISDLRYIYLELPKDLEKNLSLYNLNNAIEIRIFTSNITEKLNKLVSINKVVSEEYNKKVSEDKKNSRENN